MTTAAGQKLFAALTGLAEPMDEYIDALEQQADAATQAADAIGAQRYSLEIELLRQLGRETEAVALERARELESIDESNRALQNRIWALRDEADALEAAQKVTDSTLQTLRDVTATEIARLDAEFSAYSDTLRAEFDAKAESINRWLDTQLGYYERRAAALSDSISELTELGSVIDSAMSAVRDNLGTTEADYAYSARGHQRARRRRGSRGRFAVCRRA